jgi:hypothetical protein
MQARGPAPKRAITPKVGEEVLNLQEFQAVRQASPTRRDLHTPLGVYSALGTPAGVLQPPYQQQQQVPGLPVRRVPQGYVAAPYGLSLATPVVSSV